jgi:uncharacterized protein
MSEKPARSIEFYKEIGRKGGLTVSKNREHMAAIGKLGGEIISKNKIHMAEIGHKGGEKRASLAKKQPVTLQK